MICIDSLFSSELNYDNRLQYFCVKNCYWNILNYYGIAHAPLYLHSELRININLSNPTLFGFSVEINHSPLLPSQTWQEWQWSTNTMDLMFEIVEEKLREGIPIIVAVDGYYLPYHPLFNSEHEQHSLIISGIDRSAGTVQVIDYFPPCFMKGEIKISQLEQAYINIWGFLQKEGWGVSPESLIKETLQNVYQNLTKRKKQERQLYGTDALTYLSNRLNELDNEYISDRKAFEYFHKQIAKYMNKMKFFQFYIDHAIAYIEKGVLDSLKVEVDFHTKSWSTFNITVLRNVYSQNINHLFVRQFNGIITLQQRFIDIIGQLIDKI